MAGSVFKRLVKMGSQGSSNSIAGLAMGSPIKKVNFNMPPMGLGIPILRRVPCSVMSYD
jgi:hypothetical protein